MTVLFFIAGIVLDEAFGLVEAEQQRKAEAAAKEAAAGGHGDGYGSWEKGGGWRGGGGLAAAEGSPQGRRLGCGMLSGWMLEGRTAGQRHALRIGLAVSWR